MRHHEKPISCISPHNQTTKHSFPMSSVEVLSRQLCPICAQVWFDAKAQHHAAPLATGDGHHRFPRALEGCGPLTLMPINTSLVTVVLAVCGCLSLDLDPLHCFACCEDCLKLRASIGY